MRRAWLTHGSGNTVEGRNVIGGGRVWGTGPAFA